MSHLAPRTLAQVTVMASLRISTVAADGPAHRLPDDRLNLVRQAEEPREFAIIGAVVDPIDQQAPNPVSRFYCRSYSAKCFSA
jgi:hypothetical protein